MSSCESVVLHIVTFRERVLSVDFLFRSDSASSKQAAHAELNAMLEYLRVALYRWSNNWAMPVIVTTMSGAASASTQHTPLAVLLTCNTHVHHSVG